jgi:hypothetical protein
MRDYYPSSSPVRNNQVNTVAGLIKLLEKVQEKTGPNTVIKFYSAHEYCEVPSDAEEDYTYDEVQAAHLRGTIDVMKNNDNAENTTLYLGIY